MIHDQTVINWSIYLGGDVDPGRYFVTLANGAMKIATFDPVNRWVDEAGNSLKPDINENFVMMYAGSNDIEHRNVQQEAL